MKLTCIGEITVMSVGEIRCVLDCKAVCGEGPVWDPRQNCLWWVDITKHELHRFDPADATDRSVQLPMLVSSVALSETGIIIATSRGLAAFAIENEKINILHDPEPSLPGNRLNDMLAAADGSLWAGTMSEGAIGPTGALYRYGPNGVTTMMTGTTISNGMAWSPDGKQLYFVDSVPGVIHKWTDGQWSQFMDMQSFGKPDGMTIDSAGNLWIALCDVGAVVGLTPKGELIRSIKLPCSIVTSCAFGGIDLRTLFVTTGTFSLTEAERRETPLAGGLFSIEMEIPGLPSHLAHWPR